MSELREKIRRAVDLLNEDELLDVKRIVTRLDEAITDNIELLATSLICAAEPEDVPAVVMKLLTRSMVSESECDLESVVGFQVIARRIVELLTEEKGCSTSGE